MEILKTVDLSHILDPNELQPVDKSNFELTINNKELEELSRNKICISHPNGAVDLCSVHEQYYDVVQHLAESILEDFSIEKRSVEFLKSLGVNTFEQYKYYMTQDLTTINLIVDYANEFIKWACIENKLNIPYFASVPKLPDPTEQYINALEYVWNKYSGVV